MKEKILGCEKTLKKIRGSTLVKMLAAALLPLLWPLTAAQADQGDLRRHVLGVDVVHDQGDLHHHVLGVGRVHLAIVGDDDCNVMQS